MKDYFKLRHAINALQQEHTDRQRADLERARQAEGLLESGELDAARALYEDLLSRSPRDPGLWRALGNTLMRQERHADACRALLRSLTFELDVPEAHQALGKALLLLDEAGALCDAYLASLGVAGSSLGPYHDVAQRLGDAESRFTQESTSFEASVLHMRQGHLAVARQSLDEAVLSYASAAEVHEDKWHSAQVLASALRMRGSEAEAHLVLGRAAYEIGKNRRAVRELVQGLESDSAEADDYTRLAEAYGKLEEYEGVEQACVAGAQRFVPTPNLYHAWHASLYLRNSFEQALELAERAARELGDPLLLLHERHLSVPVMYRDEHEIEPARAAFLRGLTRFEEAVEANWEAVIQRPSDVIQTNFYLHY